MPENWKRVEELFEAASPHPPERRAQFLEEACPDDAELRKEVLSLLSVAERADTFLEEPAIQSAGQRPKLQRGYKLDHFEIVELVGQGGMGDVYRARDSRLRRDVALKVLPPDFARDPASVVRFEREARAASALTHPNIVQVYEIGHNDGIYWIAAELVPGHPLRHFIENGAVSPRRAIEIAIQIADGLAAAHAAGIIHRDLNPGNVMLTPEGRVKILDFGLAKRSRAVAGSLAAELTSPGLIMGTPGYMAPEQISGKPADPRSDIFGLGVIFYELLSGKRAFDGDSIMGIIGANLKDDPPELPVSISHALQRIVYRCLNKEPSHRFQSAADVGFALQAVSDAAAGAPPVVPNQAIWPKWIAVVAIFMALLAGAYWAGTRVRRGNALHRPVRLSLLPPSSTSFAAYDFALSPDGQRLAFVATAVDGKTNLWIRSLAASMSQQLAGTEGAMFPFWSADSRHIGFFAEGKLKTLDPGSGAVQIVCGSEAVFGATWNNQGIILFVPVGGGPIYKVRASGGVPEPVIKVSGHEALLWPSFLPDGDHFLYFFNNSGFGQSGEPGPGDGIRVGSLTSSATRNVSADMANNVQFASGRIFYVRNRSLMAQPFDARRMEVTDTPEQIAPQEMEPDVAFSRSGFSVSQNGVIVFQSAADNISRFSWFDRQGRELDSIPAIGFTAPSLSRGGNLLAVSSDDDRNGEHFIRLYDFARGTSTRLTDGISDLFPAFSPDAALVAYTHNNSIFVVPSDGSRKPEQLRTGQRCIVNDWSSDRQHLIYMNFVGAHQPELDILDVRDRSNTVYAENGAEAQFSPDGKWVAYTAPGSGVSRRNGNYYDSQVFVAPFPGPGGRVQISNSGGAQVRWRADGKEVYYISNDKKLMAVPIDTKSGKVVAGVPHVLFQTRIIAARIVLFQYAVAPDGKRFLINSLPAIGAAPLTVLAD